MYVSRNRWLHIPANYDRIGPPNWQERKYPRPNVGSLTVSEGRAACPVCNRVLSKEACFVPAQPLAPRKVNWNNVIAKEITF